MSIPKIIHQVYSQNSVLPDEIKNNIEKIKALNPEWLYRLYDRQDVADFIREHYGPAMLGYYERINPLYGAARIDLFKYLLIYKCGGVYLDIKSTIDKPLDQTLKNDDSFILAHWPNKKGEAYEGWGINDRYLPDYKEGEFQQWHIISEAGHPFMKAVILQVMRNIDRYHIDYPGVGTIGVLRMSGPIAYTLAIGPLLSLYKHRMVGSSDDIGLRYSIYSKLGEHRKLFAQHYSKLTDPIIIRGHYG
jgi:hypothetical protein